MSEPTYEVRRGSGGNALTQKVGPLPLWGWMGIGLAVALVIYFWQKNKASANSTNNASTSTENGTTEPADQVPPYIIQNYEGSNAQTVGPTTVSVNPTAPATPPPTSKTTPPTTGTITVPNLSGERANFAIGNLKSIGLVGTGTTNRNPKDEYIVASQSPPAGTKVAKGTTVKLTWKQIAAPSGKTK